MGTTPRKETAAHEWFTEKSSLWGEREECEVEAVASAKEHDGATMTY
jgi:hypothetical protein